MVFTIPTVFFNMPQTVTSGSVDFNLDEVAQLSEQVTPISSTLAQRIGDAFPSAFFESLGFVVTGREAEVGSMHRHPGNFSFSGIDLDNQVEKPGVIFRRLKCEDFVQVDSVMYIPSKKVNLVTTQTRVITVEPVENDGGIKGQYLEAPTMSYIIQDIEEAEDFSDFFGQSSKEKEKVIKFKYDKEWYHKDHPEIEDILKIFLENIEYDPVVIVDPNMIKSRTYGNSQYGAGYNRSGTYYGGNSKNKSFNNSAHTWGHSYDDDFYEEDYYELDAPLVVDVEKKRMEGRPPWRHTQTLSLLRHRKIELAKYPNIDGKGSDKDVLGIVLALKEKDYTDEELKQFLNATGYEPKEAMDMYYDYLAEIINSEGHDIDEEKNEQDRQEEDTDSILNLLKMAKDDTDLYDTIDILVESNLEDEDIKTYLDRAGLPEETLSNYWKSNKNFMKAK
jgi:hypothetical protein